jgi:hypothetical protein
MQRGEERQGQKNEAKRRQSTFPYGTNRADNGRSMLRPYKHRIDNFVVGCGLNFGHE